MVPDKMGHHLDVMVAELEPAHDAFCDGSTDYFMVVKDGLFSFVGLFDFFLGMEFSNVVKESCQADTVIFGTGSVA